MELVNYSNFEAHKLVVDNTYIKNVLQGGSVGGWFGAFMVASKRISYVLNHAWAKRTREDIPWEFV